MSTPRPNCDECKRPFAEHRPFVRQDKSKPLGVEPNGWFCPESPQSSRLRNYRPEGVAAPLEPTAEQFYEANEVERFDKDFAVYPEGWLKFAEAYAAAVSKKAERERDAAVVTLRAMCGDNWQMMGRNFAESLEKIESRESRILELEKEITALREKPHVQG